MDRTLEALINDIDEDDFPFPEEDIIGTGCWYEVWVIGYDENNRVTDTEVLLKSFDDPGEAVEYAKNVTLADIIRHPNVESAPIHEIDSLLVEVETVIDDAYGTCNVDTVYQKTIQI